jgi:hypothetical protein
MDEPKKKHSVVVKHDKEPFYLTVWCDDPLWERIKVAPWTDSAFGTHGTEHMIKVSALYDLDEVVAWIEEQV